MGVAYQSPRLAHSAYLGYAVVRPINPIGVAESRLLREDMHPRRLRDWGL